LFLSDYETWNLGARLAVKAGRRHETATIYWRRRGLTSRIDLFGAFGVGRVRISEDPQGAVLVKNNADSINGQSADEVLYRTLGWHVPFKQMGYWLRGLPEPELPVTIKLDKNGRLEKLVQSGWQVTFLQYRIYAGRELPRKLYLVADPDMLPARIQLEDDQAESFSVKIVISQWHDGDDKLQPSR
jgi:outer membrane lipoprotein LolB